MSAKEEILARIRRANSSPRAPLSEDYAAIGRSYIQCGTLPTPARVQLFIERLEDYGAVVYRGMDTQIAEVVAAALKARNKARVIIPPALPSEWLPSDIEFIRDRGMTYEQLDRSEGVLTPCVAAAALTGTIFLCHSEQHGRRALTLIPDYHLCLVFEDQIFETVPEAMRAVAPFATSPITAISGPSATSDIEMTRIKGVHGPRSLDVIVLARS